MKNIIIVSIVLLSIQLKAQESQKPATSSSHQGEFSLGVRSVYSVFSDGNFDNFGIGSGGQFRIRLGDKVNTEWFADYISTDLYGLAGRKDYHIGWSVMYYPGKVDDVFLQPYFVAGHCFDYTKVQEYIDETNSASRFSSAVQMGFGSHVNLSEKFDLSLLSQYMIHLGSDIHSERIEDINGYQHIHIEKQTGVNLEGHILLSLSLNYKIGKLW